MKISFKNKDIVFKEMRAKESKKNFNDGKEEPNHDLVTSYRQSFNFKLFAFRTLISWVALLY